MNKKLVKTRGARRDTLEAMVCTCSCNCTCFSNCVNCSGGGSWQASENNNKQSSASFSGAHKTPYSQSYRY